MAMKTADMKKLFDNTEENIYYIDRKTGEKRKEKVPGLKVIKLLYYSKSGNIILKIIKKRIFSSIYGYYMKSRFSKRKIKYFIEEFNIDMKEFEKEEYKSFNDFFKRKLVDGVREIPIEGIISPADGKAMAFSNINIDETFRIKDEIFSLRELLDAKYIIKNSRYTEKNENIENKFNIEDINEYNGGEMIIIRVNPADYHRFHFPVDCIPEKTISVKGEYHTVSPIALRKKPDIYSSNRRDITILTDNIIMVEIGAALVGSIVQTFEPYRKYEKGDEKGYFEFGGSTIILLFKKNIVMVDEDILDNTENGYEICIKMGEHIADCLT